MEQEQAFVKNIEKRIRAYLRGKQIRPNMTVLIKDDFTADTIKRLLKGMPLNIVKKGKHDAEVTPETIDDEIHDYLRNIFEGKGLKKIERNTLRPFRRIKSEELREYAKIKGFMLKQRKRDRIDETVDKLEEQHQETKFAILKSIEEIEKMQ